MIAVNWCKMARLETPPSDELVLASDGVTEWRATWKHAGQPEHIAENDLSWITAGVWRDEQGLELPDMSQWKFLEELSEQH